MNLNNNQYAINTDTTQHMPLLDNKPIEND